MIVLDVRYDYEVSTNDRLGAKQQEWLREALKVESNVTIIASGIQVFAERNFVVEELGWSNKEKILVEMIRKDPSVKKDGLVFLSGDVHFA